MEKLASQEDVVPKERIFAAVGIKVTKQEEEEDLADQPRSKSSA
jgi:hypothetical protein